MTRKSCTHLFQMNLPFLRPVPGNSWSGLKFKFKYLEKVVKHRWWAVSNNRYLGIFIMIFPITTKAGDIQKYLFSSYILVDYVRGIQQWIVTSPKLPALHNRHFPLLKEGGRCRKVWFYKLCRTVKTPNARYRCYKYVKLVPIKVVGTSFIFLMVCNFESM